MMTTAARVRHPAATTHRRSSLARPGGHGAGFSLIELLAVITMLAVLVALTLPATLRVQTSTSLNSAGELINGQLHAARQEAVSKSHEVQVLFLKLVDSNQIRAVQVRRMDETSEGPVATPITKVVWLPDGIVVEEGVRSPLLTADSSVTGTFTLPGGKNVSYTGFRFRANGSTDNSITSANNFLTLRPANAAATAPNYYTVQVNPITGKPTSYRP